MPALTAFALVVDTPSSKRVKFLLTLFVGEGRTQVAYECLFLAKGGLADEVYGFVVEASQQRYVVCDEQVAIERMSGIGASPWVALFKSNNL